MIAKTPTAPGIETSSALLEKETKQKDSSPLGRSSRVLQYLEEIESLVSSLSASWCGTKTVLESRRLQRMSYPHVLHITPIDAESLEPVEASRAVNGRDISLGGLSFSHAEPIPFRAVIVTFAFPDGHYESVVTKLTWCRFTREGVYFSGGQFLRPVEYTPDSLFVDEPSE